MAKLIFIWIAVVGINGSMPAERIIGDWEALCRAAHPRAELTHVFIPAIYHGEPVLELDAQCAVPAPSPPAEPPEPNPQREEPHGGKTEKDQV